MPTQDKSRPPEIRIAKDSLALKYEQRQYKHFIVRYFIRHDNGNLVYQFYTEDPEQTETDILQGRARQHVPFPLKFKDVLLEVFTAKIPSDRVDAAYLNLYNSHSVILRGFADSPGRRLLLEPLFEEMDKKLEPDYA